MRKILFTLSLLISISHLLSAQDQFNLCLNINPKDATVNIDNRVFHLGEKSLPFCFKIAKGDYEIEIWHPNFELFKDSITIGKRKTIMYEKSLPQIRADFSDYLKEKYEYRTRRTKRAINLGILGIAEAGLLALTFSNSPDLKGLKKEADAFKDRYYSKLSVEEIVKAETAYYKKKAEYKKERKREIFKKGVGIPLIAGTTFIALRYIRKIRKEKLVKPIFNGPDNPYTMQLMLDPVYVSAGFQMTYSF